MFNLFEVSACNVSIFKPFVSLLLGSKELSKEFILEVKELIIEFVDS
jgi:formate-dependent phosphoribosylglycinamide formyltransferase (GAR transformylase)